MPIVPEAFGVISLWNVPCAFVRPCAGLIATCDPDAGVIEVTLKVAAVGCALPTNRMAQVKSEKNGEPAVSGFGKVVETNTMLRHRCAIDALTPARSSAYCDRSTCSSMARSYQNSAFWSGPRLCCAPHALAFPLTAS